MSANLIRRNHCHASLQTIIFFLIATFTLVSCQKEINQKQITIAPTGETARGGPIPPYIFNWETATYMPSPAPGNQVQMPWNSGTTAIDPNIVGDYKSADGWVLVYNTFSPTTPLNDPSHTYFFALYNKFRGLLRFYLWQQASSVATSYVSHGLSLYGSQTSIMLNYIAKEITDLSVPQTTFSQVLNQQINSAGGTWFVFQYEMAYDPNIVNTTFPATGLTWASQWVSVSTVMLNGTQTGSIKGYLGDPNSGGLHFGSLLVNGATTFLGNLDYAQFLHVVDNGNSGPYKDAVNKGLGGFVQGFLNGILGGGSGTVQQVNLTVNTNINLTGSMVTNGGLENMKLVLPGQSNSQTADGNTPGYNSPLGIFTVVNKPNVHITASSYSTGPWVDPQFNYTYYSDFIEATCTLDNNSYSITWNPSVINSTSTGATIQNLKQQIVLLDEDVSFSPESIPQEQHDGGSPGAGSPYPSGSVPVGYGTTETIGKYSAAVSLNSTPPFIVDFPAFYYPDYTVGVRISFDVVPNNGGPKATIVKTFLANAIN